MFHVIHRRQETSAMDTTRTEPVTWFGPNRPVEGTVFVLPEPAADGDVPRETTTGEFAR